MNLSASLACSLTVIAVVRVIGFHAWPAAPPSVAHLAVRHRHVFTIRAEFGVVHGDREVEFHTAQKWVADVLRFAVPAYDFGYEFGSMSCEHIAQLVHQQLHIKPSAVEVWEDDENGSRVEFT